MPTVYPTDVDLLAFLIDAKVLPTGASLPTSLTGSAAAAKLQWESDTGYSPFYVAVDAVVSARLYDPPQSNYLDLEGGLISLPTVVVGGVTLVKDQHYWIDPANYAAIGQPIKTLKFVWRVTGLPQTISITGRWGYCSDLPLDAFQAILRGAALAGFTTVNAGQLKSERQGDVEYSYAVDAASGGQVEQWSTIYSRAVDRYKRMTL